MVKRRFGNLFYYGLSIPVLIMLFTSSFVTLRDLILWLNAYFLSDSSILMITCLLIFSCLLFTLAGVKHMAISSGFLLPLVMIFGIGIALVNTNIKDPSLLFPVFSYGVDPIWKGVMYSLSALLEVYIVILLQPFSQSPIKFKHLFILLTILTGLTIGPLTASIMEFGPTEATNYRYPVYEQWRVLSIGEYINHLDFFALYQWLSGALIRVGLLMYLIGYFFTKKLHYYRLRPPLVLFLYSILFISLLLIKVESHYFSMFIYTIYLPFSFIFHTVYIFLSVVIVFISKKRGEQHVKQADISSNS
ncbi:GerAB/ArcD/ProY family transporter [Bacillus coahuilensis]|uniref:GerAB/ArcD/ProY family transporter n=1 Tax=Bacillus coahuilensis TaxID=408580 RepID=UPI000A9CC387|nr:GerAB/ArcD/ProY family transporter [Bacillus coahuilensis]